MKSYLFLIIFLIQSLAIHSQKNDHVQGQFIVQIIDNQDIKSLRETFSREDHALKSHQLLSESERIWLLRFDEKTDEKTLLYQLKKHPSVSTVQYNHYLDLRTGESPNGYLSWGCGEAMAQPNDPQFNSQWYLFNTGQTGGNIGSDINVTPAWDVTKGGITTDNDSIVIAIVDVGTDLNHEDLKANQWVNSKEIPKNGIDDDNNGYIDDYYGWDAVSQTDNVDYTVNGNSGNKDHGVKVQGLLGAVSDNNRGIAGVNWKVRMMNIRTTDEEAIIVLAYDYILKMRRLYNQTQGKKGAFVVATNSSFGRDRKFPIDAPLWCIMYESLGKEGILNIASTSNSFVNVDNVGDLPSTCPSDYLVAVTASNHKDSLDRASGYGINNVDLAAPGINIVTTGINNTYVTEKGTSYASPLVAGAIGLAYATNCSNFTNFAKSNPASAALVLRSWLLSSTDINNDLTSKIRSGGRLNTYKLLQKVLAFCGTCQQPAQVNITKSLNNLTFKMALPSNAPKVKISYRQKGQQNWTTLDNQIPPLSINNLEACTDYEMELTSNCTDLVSSAYFFTVRTEGCCTAPTEFKFSNIKPNEFSLKFDKVSFADSYKLCISELKNGNCILEKNVTDTSVIINNLQACKKYFVSATSLCPNNKTSLDTLLSVSTKGCGACYDSAYCDSKASGTLEWIDSFAIAGARRISGKNNGYIRFDTLLTTLYTNSKVPIGIKPGFNSVAYIEGVRAWLDLNLDGDFDDTGEKIWEVAKFDKSYSDSIQLPAFNTEGVTRLRVAMKYIGSVNEPLPNLCEKYIYGEVEDYCVRLSKSTALPFIPQSDISVSPNPFNNTIFIRNINSDLKILKLELIGLTGNIIFNKNIQSIDNQKDIIEIENLPAYTGASYHNLGGVYFLKIYTNKGILTKKMIKM